MTRRKKPAPKAQDAHGLYAILGVPPDATHAAIRAAFRAKSKAAHPDKGGTAEAFASLKRACDILSNPERRKRYDATGDASEQKIDHGRGEMIAQISVVIDMIVNESVKRNVNPLHWDIAAEITNALDAELKKCRGVILGNETASKKSALLLGRFKRKSAKVDPDGEPNVLEGIIEARVRGHAETDAMLKNRERLLLGCIALVAEYDFTKEPMPQQRVVVSGYVTSGGSTTSTIFGWGG